MTEQLNVQQMAERLCAADNILVLCHKNPDGDTIGCGSALCHALKALGKTAAVLCSDAVPSRYSFTAPVPFRGEFEPKTVVAVDVASVQLFGENNGVPQYTRHVDLCIDHHAGNSGYADFTLLDGNAAAAAELLYEVISEMGVEITPLIANCLYTGLATDTGCFRFSSTTANTHLVAAKLILAGAQVEELNTLLFDTKPRERMEAERIARNHLEYHLEGRCALMYLTRDEIEQSGVDPADLEELTSLPISIEGVKVGLLLRQQPGGSYRISVRAAKGVDACAIARRLGGGGHTRAAGCELLGDLENAKNAILAEVEAELDAKAAELGIAIDYTEFNGQNDATVLNQIGAQVVGDGVDLIIPIATLAAQCMANATEGTDIPVVYAAISDPAAAGLEDIDNVTGTSDALNTPFILDMMLTANPDVKTVGLLYSNSEPNSATPIADAKAYLESKGITYVEKTGNTTDEILSAANALVGQVDAVFTPTDNVVMGAAGAVAEILNEAGIPHYTGADSFVKAGSFATCGVNYTELGAYTADMAADILEGGEIPAYHVMDGGIITVNREAAEKVGIDANVFSSMAGQVVEVETEQ